MSCCRSYFGGVVTSPRFASEYGMSPQMSVIAPNVKDFITSAGSTRFGTSSGLFCCRMVARSSGTTTVRYTLGHGVSFGERTGRCAPVAGAPCEAVASLPGAVADAPCKAVASLLVRASRDPDLRSNTLDNLFLGFG